MTTFGCGWALDRDHLNRVARAASRNPAVARPKSGRKSRVAPDKCRNRWRMRAGSMPAILSGMALGQHVIIRLRDDQVIAPDSTTRRRLARAVYHKMGRSLLAFGCADNHLHLEVALDRAQAGEAIRRLEICLSLSLALPVSFAPAHFKAITDQRHLYAAFRYVLKQARRHRLDGDRFFDGSTLIDLIGLRAIKTPVRQTVLALLPRIRRDELLALLPAPDLDARNPPLDQLAEAAMAAAALGRIDGRSLSEIETRRAALAVAERQGGSTSDVARLLGVSRRAMTRTRSLPLNEPLALAIHRQLNWREAVTREDRLSFDDTSSTLALPRP